MGAMGAYSAYGAGRGAGAYYGMAAAQPQMSVEQRRSKLLAFYQATNGLFHAAQANSLGGETITTDAYEIHKVRVWPPSLLGGCPLMSSAVQTHKVCAVTNGHVHFYALLKPAVPPFALMGLTKETMDKVFAVAHYVGV